LMQPPRDLVVESSVVAVWREIVSSGNLTNGKD
jgi:hypothetical protein